MPKILKPSDVVQRLVAGETPEQIFIGADGNVCAKLVGPQAEVAGVSDTERKIDFVISTESVDRYTDVVRLGGWNIKEYLRNPVVLWGHDDSVPAIGRSPQVDIRNGALRATAEFATREIYPLADTIYQLVKNKFLGAASVGFIPLKAKAASGGERPFGLDIIEQELLEWSVVNIPANPDCLTQARSFGIDTTPLIGWAEKTLDQGGMLLIPREELEALRKAAGAPTVGKPIVVIASGEAHLGELGAPAAKPARKIKSLWHVAWLADILMDLDCLEDCVEYEAAIEEDGSPIPQKITDALKALGQILVDMTVEEVTELLSDEDAADEVVVAPAPMVLSSQRIRVLKLLAHADKAAIKQLADALPADAPKGMLDILTAMSAIASTKAGKVLSAANEKTLRDAHAKITDGCSMVKGVFDTGQSDDTDDDGGDDEQRAAQVDTGAEERRRRARALKLKVVGS